MIRSKQPVLKQLVGEKTNNLTSALNCFHPSRPLWTPEGDLTSVYPSRQTVCTRHLATSFWKRSFPRPPPCMDMSGTLAVSSGSAAGRGVAAFQALLSHHRMAGRLGCLQTEAIISSLAAFQLFFAPSHPLLSCLAVSWGGSSLTGAAGMCFNLLGPPPCPQGC